MFKLRSMTNSIPKFLHMTSVEMEAHLGAIAVIGFSHVFRGVIAWRSLSRTVSSYFSNQLIRLSGMEMSSWIIVSIAKSPILDRLAMLKLLFHNPLQQFPYISLRPNCSACAQSVVYLSAMVAVRATERSTQVKWRTPTFMHLVALLWSGLQLFLFILGGLSDDLRRCSWILSLFRETTAFKFCDSSQKGNAQNGWEI